MALKCGATLSVGFFLLLLAATASASLFKNPWTNRTTATASASRFKMLSTNCTTATIVVGGSEHWHFGFNYTDWAFKTAPFYQKDTLVFMYDAPNGTNFPHSVYMFNNFWSFIGCDLKKAKMVANVSQGAGEGFRFVLKDSRPYYFACGEHDGIHCNAGSMKFSVWPLRSSCRG